MASGLPVFDAGSGIRDIRVWAVGIVHLSKKWHAGAGLLYSRILGDAGDSPIVDERGSKDQWIYGVRSTVFLVKLFNVVIVIEPPLWQTCSK